MTDHGEHQPTTIAEIAGVSLDDPSALDKLLLSLDKYRTAVPIIDSRGNEVSVDDILEFIALLRGKVRGGISIDSFSADLTELQRVVIYS